MAGSLFTHSAVTPLRRRRRGTTILASLLAHGGALALIVVSQLGSGLAWPQVPGGLAAFVVAAAPPAPPPAPPVDSSPPPPVDMAVNPDAAPIDASDVVLDEPPARPVRRPPVPGALPVGVPGGPVTVPLGDASLPGPPPARPQEPVRPGGDILPPTRVHYVEPEYPAVARAARVEGLVILEATLDTAGAVTNVRVLRSVPLLDRAAIDAVSKWRYTPTRLNGTPVPVIMTVTVSFTLR